MKTNEKENKEIILEENLHCKPLKYIGGIERGSIYDNNKNNWNTIIQIK